ncbi:hypothetical protein F4782DRAFT_510928 [Xylaria castorea]|nr:hypothetical protein F4782DRAFT_510928 [Xylaria castorea]
MFSKALLAAAVIGAATAQIPAVAKRDFIENRQLDGLSVAPECSSALIAVSTLYDSLPTPPADLATVTLPSDPCVTPSFTGKLESEYVSYTSSALQWYSSNSAQLQNFVTACSDLVGAEATGLPICSSYLTGLTSSGAVKTTTSAGATGNSVSPTITRATSSGPAPTGASSTSSAAPASTTAPAKGAASRETGFALVAVAAAGIMGAVMAL